MRARLSMMYSALAVIFLVGTIARSGLGQDCPVSTTVRAVDKHEQPVVNLTADELKAEINGRSAVISSFSPGGKPRIILMLDASSSMKETWKVSLAAAKELVGMAGEDIDTIVFRERIQGSAIGGSESEKLLDRLSAQTPRVGGTALYDALIEVAGHVTTRNAAFVVISDGEDNASTHSSEQTISLFARYSWPPVFGLILDYDHAETRRRYFKKIPDATGGLIAYPSSASKVTSATEELAATVLSPFVLTLQLSQPIAKTAKLTLGLVGPEGESLRDVRLLHVAEVSGCDLAPSEPAKRK